MSWWKGRSLLRIGDLVSIISESVGITPELISAIIQRQCGCKQRQQKLNEFQAIVLDFMGGQVVHAKERVLAWADKWRQFHDDRDNRKPESTDPAP